MKNIFLVCTFIFATQPLWATDDGAREMAAQMDVEQNGKEWNIDFSAPTTAFWSHPGCIVLKEQKAFNENLKRWEQSLPRFENCKMQSHKLLKSEALDAGCTHYRDEVFVVHIQEQWVCDQSFVRFQRRNSNPLKIDYQSQDLKIQMDKFTGLWFEFF